MNENFSLIANTGIQLHLTDAQIDFGNSSKALFHEWFDKSLVETNLEFAFQLRTNGKIYKFSELLKHNLISSNGEQITTDEEIEAIPNIQPIDSSFAEDIEDEDELNDRGVVYNFKLSDRKACIDKYINKWIPVPMLEIDQDNNYKGGSLNWCRCKIITDTSEFKCDQIHNVQLLFAFDTRTKYNDYSDYQETPVFNSDSEKIKTYKLCDRPMELLEFCSGDNTWVREYLLELAHGVKEIDDIDVKRGEHKYAFLATYLLLIQSLAKSVRTRSISLIRDRNISSTDVEMTIDIGNSKTSAILFEDGDFTKVKPLTLQNFTFPIRNKRLNKTQDSFDMRLAFQKVDFGCTQSDSQQFVWPSVVRLGEEAEYLTHKVTEAAEGDEALSTYSSPKRYLWDNKRRREEWRCVSFDKAKVLPLIDGVSEFFNDNGSLNKEGTGSGLHYSRKTLMTLAFIEILTQANIQINSSEYRDFHGKQSTPRKLDKIVLTCPTAMSKSEQLALHSCLSDALFILDKFYGKDCTSFSPERIKIVPELNKKQEEDPSWIFDEATCSQFVYLYGEIGDTYRNDSNEFFELYGKERNSENGTKKNSVIIGSLDIGAGTSDLMICKYEQESKSDSEIKPLPIFWDSFDFAGDDMLKILIRNVLIEGECSILYKELAKRDMESDSIKRLLNSFFSPNRSELSFKDRIIRRDFNLQVLVPVMYYYLDLYSKGEKYAEVSYDTIFNRVKPSEDVENRFAQHFGFSLKEIKWSFDSDIVTANIRLAMNDIITCVANITYAYDCDIILLSGRPASLSPIREMFLKVLPTSPDRIIVLNKYRIGKWYPFADDYGYLKDSKSIVSVGAMIGYLSSTKGMNGFATNLSELGKRLKPTTESFVYSHESFITHDKHIGKITTRTFPIHIESRQFDYEMYPSRPFYMLGIDDDAIIEKLEKRRKQKGESPLDIEQKQTALKAYKDNLLSKRTFEIEIGRENYEEQKEVLNLLSILASDDKESLDIKDFSLCIQSLNDPDCYWLDSGAFTLNIS